MKTPSFLKSFSTWGDPVRQQAMADAYSPIVRGFLLPACIYYFYITWSHWNERSGLTLLALAPVSALTAISYYLIRQHVLTGDKVTLRKVEMAGLLTNLFMYLNVLGFMLVAYEESKLIYFSLMAVAFSTTGVTYRGTFFSIGLSLTTLYYFASHLPQQHFTQYVSIGVTTAFAGLGMATLLRKAILRQMDARLLADRLASKAQRLADTDMLTGIPNRRAVFQKIDYFVENRRPFWLGIYDLDGFKAINDVYGHVTGDRLLCAVVDRASELNMEGATFGRIGGDEFVAILPGSLTEAEITDIANEIIEVISRPYPIDILNLTIGASAGFSHFPAMGLTGAQLYEKADYALYKAKYNHRGHCVLFDTADDEEMAQAIAIERELREGDLENELFLEFQPQYSPLQQKVVSFEALARWHNPKLGTVRPDLFIRAAERSGHIRKVTDILFSKGLAELAKWPADISLSFNLSAFDISDRAFILSLLRRIMESGISPRRIEFEITETAVMSDLEASRSMLEDLRASGCKIALDDFGSGYSSFEYLDQLPLDKVKIDRSFIRKVSQSMTSREIVASIIGLCRKLDLRCVLEGVETEDEMAILAALQPDLIQGYLYGRPMSGENALKRIDDQQQPQTTAEQAQSA